jgi:squalene-hopene/tetraprenyl-beta-curcumene cyclase
LCGADERHGERLRKADRYVEDQGGAGCLRERCGQDRAMVASILAASALAGLVPWRKVPPLAFQWTCLPAALRRYCRDWTIGYALPAQIAIGQARLFHRRPWNPLLWLLRRLAVPKSTRVLQAMQAAGGGFFETVPLTSFVVMGLAATGRAEHDVVRRGVAFLLDTLRADGSWPIDTGLAVWNTTLAIDALSAASGDVGALGCLDWLLDRQGRETQPLFGAAPGGWGRSDAAAAVPDVDGTAAALLALKVLLNSGGPGSRQRIHTAAADGVAWLLDIQNADGGWPTFCRGSGTLPADRSGPELTAHALRALDAWRNWFPESRIDEAVRAGLDYLAAQQRPDGSWLPLWFGNEHYTDDENPIYGTARVLLAYRDLGLIQSEPAQRGLRWLIINSDPGGGWGAGPGGMGAPPPAGVSSVEETAVAVEALLAARNDPAWKPAIQEGLQWLLTALAARRHHEAAPIGFSFGRLWYYERIYPLAFAVAALGQAIRSGQPLGNEHEPENGRRVSHE